MTLMYPRVSSTTRTWPLPPVDHGTVHTHVANIMGIQTSLSVHQDRFPSPFDHFRLVPGQGLLTGNDAFLPEF